MAPAGKLPCGEGPSRLRLLVTRERCASRTGPFSSSPTCAQLLTHLLTPALTGPGTETPDRKACAPPRPCAPWSGPFPCQAQLRGHLAAFVLIAPSSPTLLFAFEEAGCTTQDPQGREHGKARRDGSCWPGSPAGPGQNSWVRGQGRCRRHRGPGGHRGSGRGDTEAHSLEVFRPGALADPRPGMSSVPALGTCALYRHPSPVLRLPCASPCRDPVPLNPGQ